MARATSVLVRVIGGRGEIGVYAPKIVTVALKRVADPVFVQQNVLCQVTTTIIIMMTANLRTVKEYLLKLKPVIINLVARGLRGPRGLTVPNRAVRVSQRVRVLATVSTNVKVKKNISDIILVMKNHPTTIQLLVLWVLPQKR